LQGFYCEYVRRRLKDLLLRVNDYVLLIAGL
jgi:hypothetical protein